MTFTTRSRFWGPHFPDVWATGKTFWGPHFPDPGPLIETVGGAGPAGVATFVLDLEAELEMTLEWQTDVFKPYAGGQERRIAVLDFPRRRFRGSALLVGGASVRTLRSQLKRWAAAGSAFDLGLPFEGLRIVADTAGTSVSVAAGALASCDWANPGQRVVIVSPMRTAINAVVQSAGGTTITLDVTPGAIGKAGGYIMPTLAVYLDPQQGFQRWVNADGFERWAITATAARFGFEIAALHASLNLATAPAAGSGALANTRAIAKSAGVAGNGYTLSFLNDVAAGAEFIATVGGTQVELHYNAGTTTMSKVVSLLGGSADLSIAGTPTLASVLTAADAFVAKPLSGGADATFATEGLGGVVATHATRPVFDRDLTNKGTIGDSLQAMNEIVDLGGVPVNRGQATHPDWGRHVEIGPARQGAEWQWIKRFLSTVRGRQKAFWLPTWRKDLKPTASGIGTLTIEGPDDDDGGFFAWYPTQKDIQIVQADGTITRATITNAVDNGNGTITLTIGVTLSGSAISMVSWLELCRLEHDEIQVQFVNHLFSIQANARVVTL